jgi:hypothetical protein
MKKLFKGQRHKPSKSSTPPLIEPTSYLAMQKNSWADRLRASGHTVPERETPTDTGKYIVTFVSRKGAPGIKIDMQVIQVEPCPACGTLLNPDGRCRDCWGDVMGLCDTCNVILEDVFVCPACAPNEHTIPTA